MIRVSPERTKAPDRTQLGAFALVDLVAAVSGSVTTSGTNGAETLTAARVCTWTELGGRSRAIHTYRGSCELLPFRRDAMADEPLRPAPADELFGPDERRVERELHRTLRARGAVTANT